MVEFCYPYREKLTFLLIYMELTLHWTVSASAKREHRAYPLPSSREAVAVYIDRTRSVRVCFCQPFRGIRTGFQPLLMILARADRDVCSCISWYPLFS
jgi:hypothetical protein